MGTLQAFSSGADLLVLRLFARHSERSVGFYANGGRPGNCGAGGRGDDGSFDT